MNSLGLVLMALALEAALGWPHWLYARIRHPVVWIGALIGALETRLNSAHLDHRHRYALGALSTLVVVGTTVMASISLLALGAWAGLPGWLLATIEVLVMASLLASRGLAEHVRAVARPLGAGALEDARLAVGHIVGRDPRRLDAAGVARAALESLAENASDGVVAPLFWGAILGLPGMAGYKALNTLDSMIGHRSRRYAAFGGFAARADDWANWIPARLTGVAFAVASGPRLWDALWVMARDARAHRSPNAGWPEAALAAALGVRLSGPRTYNDHVSDEPWLNADAPNPDAANLTHGLVLYWRMLGLVAIALAGMSLALTMISP